MNNCVKHYTYSALLLSFLSIGTMHGAAAQTPTLPTGIDLIKMIYQEELEYNDNYLQIRQLIKQFDNIIKQIEQAPDLPTTQSNMLGNLPAEIINSITDYLNIDDIKSLHQTSHDLKNVIKPIIIEKLKQLKKNFINYQILSHDILPKRLQNVLKVGFSISPKSTPLFVLNLSCISDLLDRQALNQAINKNLRLLKLLINHGANINAQNSNGWTPLIHILNQLIYTQIHLTSNAIDNYILTIINARPDVNMATHKSKMTALYMAIQVNSPKRIIYELLKAGAKTNIRNTQNQTPLNYAQNQNNQDAIDVINKFQTYEGKAQLIAEFEPLNIIDLQNRLAQLQAQLTNPQTLSPDDREDINNEINDIKKIMIQNIEFIQKSQL